MHALPLACGCPLTIKQDRFSAAKLRSPCSFSALLFSLSLFLSLLHSPVPFFLSRGPWETLWRLLSVPATTLVQPSVDRPCRRTLFTFHLPRSGRSNRDFFSNYFSNFSLHVHFVPRDLSLPIRISRFFLFLSLSPLPPFSRVTWRICGRLDGACFGVQEENGNADLEFGIA